MSIHEPTPMFETYNPAVFELDYGLLLKEWDEFEKEKATDAIPRTLAHFISRELSDVAYSKETVAQHMKSFGMDVIPVCGDELAVMEGVEEDLGLTLEHVSEINSAKFDELIEDMKRCLHQLGWNYDGWVDEGVEDSGLVIFH